MTEPRDRHTAHADPAPPWNIRRWDTDNDNVETLSLKPDDPIRKLFERDPNLTGVQFNTADGGVFIYDKTYPNTGVPNLGMDTDEANAAVYLILLALAEAARWNAGPFGERSLKATYGHDFDDMPVMLAAGHVVEVLDQFESTTGVSLGDVTETAAKAITEWARSQP